MDPAAQRHLADRLDLIRHMRGVPNAEHAVESSVHAVVGALDALHAVGAVSDAERNDWRDRTLEAAGGVPAPQLPRRVRVATTTSATVSATSLDPAPGSRRSLDTAVRPRDAHVPRFLRLVAASDEEHDLFGGRLRIVGVELLDGSTAVLWRMAPLPDVEAALADDVEAAERDTEGLPEDERARMRAQRARTVFDVANRMALTDDAGTRYRHSGGGASGSGAEMNGRMVFVPSPPPHATALVVDVLGTTVRIPLASADTR